MSKRQVLCLLGVIVIIFLFLGIPSMWHKIIAVVIGISIILVAYNLDSQKSSQETSREAFTENNPQP